MSDFQSSTTQPPAKKSSAKLILIILGVLGLGGVLCCGGCVYFSFFVAPGMIGNQAITLHGDHPEFQSQIGANASASLNWQKTGEEGQSNQGALVFDVSGDNGSGELVLKQQGQDFAQVTLRTAKGEFDLLE